MNVSLGLNDPLFEGVGASWASKRDSGRVVEVSRAADRGINPQGEFVGLCQRILQRLDFLGARLDEDRNRDCLVSAQDPVACISVSESRTPIVVVFADEAAAIAGHTRRIVEQSEPEGARTIPVAISARHVHLDREACDALFGTGHELTPRRPVTQPGQYACEERVDIIGLSGLITPSLDEMVFGILV